MSVQPVDFRPVAQGGDNGTSALMKLSQNCVELDVRVDDVEAGIADATAFSSRMKAFRNRVINGDFRFWQAGLTGSQTSVNAVGWGDRWLFQAYPGSGGSGNSTITGTAQAFALGQTDVPVETPYFCRLKASALGSQGGTGSIIRMLQYIEDVRTFGGQVMAVSFWAKADSNRTIVVAAAQAFGTGGSAAVVVNGTAAITTVWARYTVYLTMPSVAGKTVGTNSNVNLSFYLYNQDTTGGVTPVGTWTTAAYLDICGVQAEAVATNTTPATDFEYRALQVEQLLVQRYSRPTSQLITGRFGSSSSVRFFQPLNPPMRRTPDISFITANLNVEATQVAIYSMNTPAVGLSGGNETCVAIDLNGTISGGTPSAGALAQLNTANAFILRAEF